MLINIIYITNKYKQSINLQNMRSIKKDIYYNIYVIK